MSPSSDNARNLLRQLGQALKLDQLDLDESNTARLVFDDRITVDFEADPEQPYLHAYAVLCALPADDSARAQLLEGLLAECLVMPGELPVRIVVDRSIGMLLLSVPIPTASTEFEPFEKKVGALVNLTEEWMTRLERGEFGESRTKNSGGDNPNHSSLAI